MIIKDSDNRENDLSELNRLLELPQLSQEQKNQIQREIRNIQSGLKGEKEAAYQINFLYGNNKNWAVIHDLRLELEGHSAQIDHLLINRFLEIYVCESKRFGEGIAINEYGEFSAFYQGKPYGIASPIEQNNRHQLFLSRLFRSDEIELPVRMGLKMKPSLYSLILVANSAIIHRPKKSQNPKELERIIKNEQLKKRIDKDIDEISPSTFLHQMASMSKIVSTDTVIDLAQKLVKLHKPLQINWKARFGIVEPENNPETNPKDETQPVPAQRLFCCSCHKTVSENVAKFCWQNKVKFNGKVYCFTCQKTVGQK